MIHPIVLAVLVTAGLGLLLAAVSMMLLHTVKGRGRHRDEQAGRPQTDQKPRVESPGRHLSGQGRSDPGHTLESDSHEREDS